MVSFKVVLLKLNMFTPGTVGVVCSVCNSHMLLDEIATSVEESEEGVDVEADGSQIIFSPQAKEAPKVLDHISAKLSTEDGGTRFLTLLKPVRRDPLRFATKPLTYSPKDQLELWWETGSNKMSDFDTVELTIHIHVPQVDSYAIALEARPNTGTAMIELPDLLDQLCEEHNNSPQVRSRKALRRRLGFEACAFFVLWVEVEATCSTDTSGHQSLKVSTPPLRFCVDKDC